MVRVNEKLFLFFFFFFIERIHYSGLLRIFIFSFVFPRSHSYHAYRFKIHGEGEVGLKQRNIEHIQSVHECLSLQDDPLWSARLLHTNPEAVVQMHKK